MFGPVWQYYAITNHTDAKKGGAKNAIGAFCDKSFSGCSTFRAAAHILGPECKVLTQCPPPLPAPGRVTVTAWTGNFSGS